MLDKTYRPTEVESRHYARWQDAGAFACGRRAGAAPYTIVIPPPNVTGSLHIGHALNNTLQDVLIRWRRMQGRDVLWQPGTDHAGIATQMVVERQLENEGVRRRDLGREAFVDKVWEWKERSGGTITLQLQRLGASCDWSRERFTMDEGLSVAVRKIFVDLYKQGLIYRDKRLVNWDPKLETAISDLEVQSREVKGKLWYFKYPVEGAADRFITVATTRPETMLGDTAVAVHPDDRRYTELVGRHCILPLVGRRLPIVADEHADPEQGSGAVKITPAHDFNDFDVGRRHGLEMVNVLDPRGYLNENAPEAYRGLDRFEARDRVVADMEAQGLVERVEEHLHVVPYGDRGGVPVEPYLTDQWYVDAKTLAQPAIKAVDDGRTRFVPAQWTKTYYEWMRNIQPWCISRQLWWGHQIPAWYGPDGEIFVELTEADAKEAARTHYGTEVELTRDPDVLDTWFSSALWPFSTLGWPEETPEVARYYPTDVLVTSFDIIFFWVARMMMMGLHFMREIPFHTVYIHALVRDVKGQKMSKSKGNVMDPLELIDKYGADALRFTLTAMATQGRDIKLSEGRLAGYRNFVTKLWNAARLTQMNGCVPDPAFDPAAVGETLNRWIVGALTATVAEVTDYLDEYKFDQAAAAIYRFTWHTFCDWYLEFIKPVLQQGGDAAAAAETRATAAWALGRLLHLLHPFMPFVTEELWQQLGPKDAGMLITAPWPEADAALIDRDAAAEMDWVVQAVSEVRAVRGDLNVPASARPNLYYKIEEPHLENWINYNKDFITRASNSASLIPIHTPITEVSANAVFPGGTFTIPLQGVIDVDAERQRLSREVEKLTGEIARLDAKLANENFLAKAPAEVVEEQHERRTDAATAHAKLAAALARLPAT